ncbi:MAG: hypothetical protein U0795_19445 [Pirellulales bacterium]
MSYPDFTSIQWWFSAVVCRPFLLFEAVSSGPTGMWYIRVAVIFNVLIATIAAAAIGFYCRKAWLALVAGAVMPTLLAWPVLFITSVIGGGMHALIIPCAAVSSFWMTGGIAWLMAKIALSNTRSTPSDVSADEAEDG